MESPRSRFPSRSGSSDNSSSNNSNNNDNPQESAKSSSEEGEEQVESPQTQTSLDDVHHGNGAESSQQDAGYGNESNDDDARRSSRDDHGSNTGLDDDDDETHGSTMSSPAVVVVEAPLPPPQESIRTIAVAATAAAVGRRPGGISFAAAGELDYMCDRGNAAKAHPGNRRLHSLVAEQLERYQSTNGRAEKRRIQEDIVQSMKSSGGRFLVEDKHLGRWHEVSDEDARVKVGQQIRHQIRTLKKEALAREENGS